MASLGSTYLTINGNALHETSSFSISPECIESVFQTEAGTDTTIFKRGGKMKMSCGWEGAPDSFRTLAEGFCSAPSCTVIFDGVTRTMRARNLKENMIRYSNRYTGSKGLWNISFDLEEF